MFLLFLWVVCYAQPFSMYDQGNGCIFTLKNVVNLMGYCKEFLFFMGGEGQEKGKGV